MIVMLFKFVNFDGLEALTIINVDGVYCLVFDREASSLSTKWKVFTLFELSNSNFFS